MEPMRGRTFRKYKNWRKLEMNKCFKVDHRMVGIELSFGRERERREEV
jgi:hypothetical protein